MAAQESTGIMELVAGVLASASILFNTWFWYDKKRRDKLLDAYGKRLDDLDKSQAVQEHKFVDDRSARIIVRDETASLKEQHAELKGMVMQLSEGVNSIAASQGVQTEILKNLEKRLDEMGAKQ